MHCECFRLKCAGQPDWTTDISVRTRQTRVCLWTHYARYEDMWTFLFVCQCHYVSNDIVCRVFAWYDYYIFNTSTKITLTLYVLILDPNLMMYKISLQLKYDSNSLKKLFNVLKKYIPKLILYYICNWLNNDFSITQNV